MTINRTYNSVQVSKKIQKKHTHTHANYIFLVTKKDQNVRTYLHWFNYRICIYLHIRIYKYGYIVYSV